MKKIAIATVLILAVAALAWCVAAMEEHDKAMRGESELIFIGLGEDLPPREMR